MLLVEAYGKRVARLGDATDDVVGEALATLRALVVPPANLRAVRALTVHTFDGEDAAAAEPLFSRAGFTRDSMMGGHLRCWKRNGRWTM